MGKRISQYKPVMGTYTEEQIEWIKSNAKSAKLNTTEFMRALLDHVRATTNGDLKKTLVRGKLEAELNSLTNQEQKLLTRKTEIEQTLESLA